jgi:hypothetical protein
MKLKSLIAAVLVGISLSSCYYDTEEELYPDNGTTITCDTTNVLYSTTVKSILDAKCNSAACHGGTNSPSGIQLDDYAALKTYLDADAARFVSSIVQDGNASNMPKGDAKMSDCNINSIKAWINKGYPNN